MASEHNDELSDLIGLLAEGGPDAIRETPAERAKRTREAQAEIRNGLIQVLNGVCKLWGFPKAAFVDNDKRRQ